MRRISQICPVSCRQGNKDLLPVKTRLMVYPITIGAFTISKPLSGESATQ